MMMKSLIGMGLCAGLLAGVVLAAEEEAVTEAAAVIKKEAAVGVAPVAETAKPAAEKAAPDKDGSNEAGTAVNAPVNQAVTGGKIVESREAIPEKAPTGAEITATVKEFLEAESLLQGGFLHYYEESAKKAWQMTVKGVRDPFKDEKGFGALADAEATGVKRAIELVVRIAPDGKCGGYHVVSYDVRKVDRRAKYELKGTPVK